jgi:lipoprotein NlpI
MNSTAFGYLMLFGLVGPLFAAEGLAASDFEKRGEEHFKRGEIKEAIADFDKVIELRPGQEPYHWQRGIAYYYAGEYQKGRRQFELHQTVNPNDVENAVWHFLCVAKTESFDKARQQLISIHGDSRVPMTEIYRLFAGKGSAEAVLAAATEGDPSPTERKSRLFYAHLYLGLYDEAKGNRAGTLEHIRAAVRDFGQPHYMGDVARVHLGILQKKE